MNYRETGMGGEKKKKQRKHRKSRYTCCSAGFICPVLFGYFAGAAAASRVYVDALSRLARQAQLGTWGGSKDVGKFRNLLIIVVVVVKLFCRLSFFVSFGGHMRDKNKRETNAKKKKKKRTERQALCILGITCP